jgi:MerR family transcriptional regulator, heat shock protein HspR
MRRQARGPKRSVTDTTVPKYSIAVASDLSGIPQQQLRRMEESGLLTPMRTDGNTRRYSDDDVTRMGEIAALADEGANAAGIRHIQRLQVELQAAYAEIARLRQLLAASALQPPDATVLGHSAQDPA